MTPSQRKSITGLVAAVALATGLSTTVLMDTADGVSELEGLETTAYPDMGNPAIATVCYGETEGVSFGDRYTPEQCAEMLIKRLPDYLAPINKLLPNLPDNRQVAYGLFSWNLGVGALTLRSKKCVAKNSQGVCIKKVDIPGTSIVDLDRSGDWQAACRRMLRFDHIGAKVIRGLTIRRQKEYRICMGGAA